MANGRCCRPRAAACGRPQAGLEDVDKVSQLLNSMDATERNAGMLLFLHPRPESSHARRAGYGSSFSSFLVADVLEDAWLSGDCPGQGLLALPAFRLEHRAHLAPPPSPSRRPSPFGWRCGALTCSFVWWA
jgi:hypothetical protein